MDGFWLLLVGVALPTPMPMALFTFCNLCEIMGEEAVEMLDMGDKTIEWLMVFTPTGDPVNVIGICLVSVDCVVTMVA